MPLLGFKNEFAQMVEEWIKRHTIRARRKDGRDPKRGDILYCYTGLRTKHCRKLVNARCTAVLPIHITKNGHVILCGCRLNRADIYELAYADGFRHPAKAVVIGIFFQFFKRTHGLPFHGLLICWGPDER